MWYLQERAILAATAKENYFGQHVVNGDAICTILQNYVTKVSQSGGELRELSQLPTQTQMIQQLSGERAVRAALDNYKKTMSSFKLPVSSLQLSRHHSTAYDQSLVIFSSLAGALDNREAYLSALQ